MKNEIMVSVCCMVYNHAKYLRKCLDGFIMQNTNFKFEVLIHDDASTDSSQDIIREYEEKYPDVIKPIYQTENQYSKGINIGKTYQYPRVSGKYVAFCEGDDYWCDKNKLQKQFDALENNPQCGFCTHKVECVNEDGSPNQQVFPIDNMKNGVISGLDILNQYPKWLFHATSFFIRNNIIYDLYTNYSHLMEASPVGDSVLLYFSASKADFIYVDEVMSKYRLFSKNSWTKSNLDNTARCKSLEKFEKYVDVFEKYLEQNNVFIPTVLKEARIRYHIERLEIQGNFKEIYCFKNSETFKSRGYKFKIIVYLSKFVPWFEKMFNKHYYSKS